MLNLLFTRLPRRSTLAERLTAIPAEDLPTESEVTIHWDDHQIPFIEASSDTDLACALGVVHAHLRLGQMEMLRRLSQGRLAEMAGPIATDIDHSLRILNFARAVPEIEAAMPPETRHWLGAFVDGINHYQRRVARLPTEYRVFGLKREPWSVSDILTLGRLAATDVNWLVWFPLLRLRDRDDWAEIWTRLVETGSASLPSFRKRRGRLRAFVRLLGGYGRHGSNAFAVAGRRSQSNGALMANDPHLELLMPNLWLIAGLKSPSYHAVGLMLPGLPFLGLGRNQNISWGGTNMRAASSDLYDISDLDSGAIRERTETIKVRWWRDRKIKIRETDLGPVLSDAPVIDTGHAPPFALRWVGHQPSDEFTAMLRMNRAGNWQQFRDAFESFAVSGLNMVYADREGNIGQLLAVQLPNRAATPPRDLILDPADGENGWGEMIGARRLPTSFNPETGFLVSANNRPVDAGVPISFFFAPDDRVERITRLLDKSRKLTLDDLRVTQRDVYMSSAVALRDLLIEKIEMFQLEDDSQARSREFITLLRAWDGHYRASSRGALAFELLLHYFARLFYDHTFTKNAAAGYSGVVRIKLFLMQDIEKAKPGRLASDLEKAIQRAAARLRKFGNWGDMHRLKLAHPLANLPLIGRRYRFGHFPVGGSSDTIMKTAHGVTDKRHATDYGANARHVSDLSDPDLNWFVLFGGQDGWFRSSTFTSQVPLWLEGGSIQVPLRMETVRRTFRHKILLKPAR